MKRLVIVIAIVMFAIVSAPRLRLEYTPAVALPELRVNLFVGGGASDPEEVTTRWVVPIESAIRSLGDVTGTRAEVWSRSASITVRFRRGTDVEVKAARLQSELAGLRAKLPRGSSLRATPAGQRNQWAALIAVTDRRVDARRVADMLRAARGVRDVETYGLTEREVEIAMTTDAVPASAVREATAALAPRALGTMKVKSREVPVIAAPRTTSLAEATLRAGSNVIRLGAVADVRSRVTEPLAIARVNGKAATLLALYRDDDVSLFAFDASVRERLRGIAHEEISSDAAELRKMLSRVAIGVVVATVLLALIGFVFAGPRGLVLGAYLPVAIAIAMNVFRLASMTIDAHTIIAGCIALAAFAPFAVWRLVAERNERWPLAIGALFALLVPIAATYGSAALAPVLAPASRAFVVAALAALGSAGFQPAVPPPSRRRELRRQDAGGTAARMAALLNRTLLRESATVLLAAATLTCALLAYFGRSLDPRAVGESESSVLAIDVRMPSGATLAQTSAVVERVEKGLAKVRGIRRFTSLIDAGSADVQVEIEPAMSKPANRWRFLIALRSAVPFVPGLVTLNDRSRGRAVSFVDDFELEPFTNDEATVYRVLLKGTDAEALRRIADLIPPRLLRIGIRRGAIESEWQASTTRAELVPRRDTPAEEAARMAGRLAELTTVPPAFRLPDGRLARVIPRGAPRSQDVVPQRADLVARAPSLDSKFELHNAYVPGGVKRELGRFVLPIRISIRLMADRNEHVSRRAEVDRILSTMPLPTGVTLERPSLSEWTFSVRKLRLFALAAFLPMLLFAAAAIALASMRRAMAAVATSAVGIAAAAPVLKLTSATVDELTLLAIAASICGTTAIAVVVLLRGREQASAAYRAQRRFAVPTIAALLAVIVLLAVPASAPAAATDGWRAPMLASLAVLGAGIPAALFVAPAIGFVTRDVRRRRSPVARAASHPQEWRDALPHLAIRNVTKRYADGFRALHRVSFELAPGIIGLLGPNGAGKTTLLRVMTGLLMPTRGQVLYRGVVVGAHNLAEYRRLIGFLPQEFNAYAGLTAADFLDFWALERGMTDARVRRAETERLLEVVGLSQDASRRVRDFSGGMRQRIGIARALLGDPPLLVVDEPTTGLDLESRNRFRDLLATLAGERIIILSTHIAGDVEATASRILLLAKGTLRWDGAPEDLIARARGRVFDAVVSENDARSMTTHFRVTTRKRVAGGIHVRGVVPPETPLPGEASEPTLEEAYLAEVAGDRALRASGFAFLFEKGAA